MEAASATLARRRGNRAALVVALARVLGLRAELALARSPTTAPPEAPVRPAELDDFGELLVRFEEGPASAPRVQYVDPRWRHAPFGYLPPALDGAVTLRLPGAEIERARSALRDQRSVEIKLQLEPDGSGQGTVIERLQGWPAIEWAEAKKRTADDESKLRQDFEQRWLGHHFPGARLGGLVIDVDPARPGHARLRYSFSSAQLATASGGALELTPSFFQTHLGRRFATERRRRTALVVGVDTPLTVSAELTLPPGARLLDAGSTAALATGPGQAIKLSERRAVREGAERAGERVRVLLERRAEVPLVRVPPETYDKVALELRRMDRLEQAEIRFAIAEPGR